MRFALLTFLFAAAPALAQEASPASGDLPRSVLVVAEASGEDSIAILAPEAGFGSYGGVTLGQRLMLVGGAFGSGAVGFWLIGPFAPAAIVGGVYGTGRLLGLGAPLQDVLWDSLLASGVGVATFAGTTFYFTVIEGQPNDFGVGIASLITGVSAFALTTALLYKAQPTVLVTPEGESVPGLSLRIGL